MIARLSLSNLKVLSAVLASCAVVGACGGGDLPVVAPVRAQAQGATPTAAAKPAVTVATVSTVDATGLSHIAGKATQLNGVKLLTWENEAGVRGQATLSGVGAAVSWVAKSVPLHEGDNALAITIQDSYGNTSRTTLVLTRTVPDAELAIHAKVPVTEVRAADVTKQARPAIAFASQAWGNVQCNGSVLNSQDIPESGIQGSPLSNGETLRFGRVADRANASDYSYQFALNVDDAITAGSHRCELAFAPDAKGAMPRGTAFWHAYAVKIPDAWRGTSDEVAIAQWHAGDTSGGMLPVYTLLVRGNVMRLVLRYDGSAVPTRETATTLVVWSMTDWPSNRWLRFVTQALVSTDTALGPFVRTWMNGRQLVNYNGPVGYNQPAVQSYAKHGIYHWVDPTNEWDRSLPTRTLNLKGPLLVRDAEQEYRPHQIAVMLNED